MRSTVIFATIIWALHLTTVLAKFGEEEQDFGYIEVRPGCHMFYWLYYAIDDREQYVKKPLLIWLQGGPGSASTGHGNFMTMGPLDLNLQTRPTTWVKLFNVLYIDSPVGVGFSYLEHASLLVHSNKEIANDLLVFMAGFYNRHPEFVKVPLFICGQAYGGKMAIEFGLALVSSLKAANKTSNVEAILLGNPWVSPIDSMLAWSPLLERVGLVDVNGAARIRNATLATKALVEKKDYAAASKASYETMKAVVAETHGVNFHNVMKRYKRESTNYGPNTTVVEHARRLFGYENDGYDENAQLKYMMNREVKLALRIPAHVRWIAHSKAVFRALFNDFMVPVTEEIQILLNTTDVKIVIYNGNNDLICATMGQELWLEHVHWVGAHAFKRAPREAIWYDGQMEGYFKRLEKLKFYWFIGAGHWAPADNPFAVNFMLRQLLRKLEDYE